MCSKGAESMKIVLVATHQLSMEFDVALDNCLGILLLASSISNQDVDCRVMDFYGRSLFNVDNPEEKLREIIAEIVDTKPDVLGLSTMSNNLVLTLDICKQVKDLLPNTYSLLGGPGVSFKADRIMEEFSYIDGIIRGEADEAFPELIRELANNKVPSDVKGLVFRHNGQIIDNGWPSPIDDLDATPVPMFKLLETKHEGKEPTTSIEVGRGCPFNCIFCSTSAFFKRKYRVKSIERIQREIDEILKYSDDSRVSFNHDLLTFNREYVVRLASAIKKIGKPISWSASVRLDTVDLELLKTMRDAGCDSLFIGIEVATPRMQKIIKKGLDLSSIEETVQQLINLKFGFTLSFIVGFPEEDENDLLELLTYALKFKYMSPKKVTVQIHSLCPISGSTFYSERRHELVYDDYGSPGHTDFPRLEWARLRETITKYPDIFPIYYHVNRPKEIRERYLKLAFLARLIDGSSSHSIREANRVLGNELAQCIFSNISEVQLPPPGRSTGQMVGMLGSLRAIILKDLRKRNLFYEFYDTVSETEQVLSDMLAKRDQSSGHIIQSKYDPMELIDFVAGRIERSALHERNRYTAFLWDSENEKAKTVEVPEEFGEVLKQYL